ncbi:Eukaryotic translation initiation factor 3 subunit B [Aphelenchoides fujianensis]|nr:Eukaryotic translation initiation factor 3 subunit B [Aphelenchoides fujianensis]
MAIQSELETLLAPAQTKDDFSDPEDYEDDISDSGTTAGRPEPTPDVYKERCLIVFGLPKATQEKLPKLESILNKFFKLQDYEHVHHIPVDENGTSKGYCFIEYPSKEIAEAARLVLDGLQLDRNHTFSAYSMTAIHNAPAPEPNWKAPEKRKYPENVGDLWWYVKNPKCFDQFAVQVQSRKNAGVSLVVYSMQGGNNNPGNWSEHIFKWSPYGTYLCTLHKPGVQLWGGPKWERWQRYGHEMADYIEFSPRESYLVTYSSDEKVNAHTENSLRIFDVFTGECKKSFSPSQQGSGVVHSWPFFKWSHDEAHFGFCRPKGNNIYIYDTTTFTLNENKPIELDGLVTFEWNPSKNLIAYYCEERPAQNAPAEIGVIAFPSRAKERAQRIFSVSAANLFWQKAGNYLAAHTERYNSVRKNKEGQTKLTGVASHLEIFDFSDKLVAVQTLQLTEPFIAFGWEPKGDRFCVLQGSSNKTTPLVYRMDKGKPAPQCISKLEAGIQLNTVSWAPQGGWLAVFAASSSAGHVFFIDTNGSEATKIRGIEHPSVNYGSWDPTGRYFVTGSLANSRYDPSYRIHTFQGREVYKKSIDTIMRFKWRPRPPVHLTEQKQKEIRRNLKQISAKFEEEDRREQQQLSKEMLAKRKETFEAFNSRRTQHRERYEEERQQRMRLRNGLDTDEKEAVDMVEEQLTVVVNTEKKELPSSEE